jgi:hypothetical protein
MRKTNELTFPVFLECRNYAPDKFWSKIFEDLAYNQPPPGVFIKNNHLCFNKNKQNISYYIYSENNYEKLFKYIYNLLHSDVGILSPNEKAENINKFNTSFFILKDKNISWSDIRKKHIKDVFIELFIIKIKNKYNLSIKESKKLLSVIQTSFLFKNKSNNDVHFENGEIKSINGLMLSEKTYIFDEQLFTQEEEEEEEDQTKYILNINLLINLWSKYLNENNKKKK